MSTISNPPFFTNKKKRCVCEFVGKLERNFTVLKVRGRELHHVISSLGHSSSLYFNDEAKNETGSE